MKKIVKSEIMIKAVVVIAITMALSLPGSAAFTNSNILARHTAPGYRTLLDGEWTEQSSGFETPSRGIRYVHAVNQNISWAIAYDGSGSNTPTTDMTMTKNGGNLWTANSVLGDTGYGLGNICGLNETIGYVALFNNGAAQDQTCGVYKTNNSGVTWTHLTGALQGSASFANNVYFWNENEGVALGDTTDGYFEDYTTTDGGRTWMRVPQANYTGVPVQSGEAGWTGVMKTVGNNTIIFGSNKGNVYISNDRGNHWVASYSGIDPNAGTNTGVNDIAFKDPNHGLVAHDNEGGTYDLYETSDGGKTWTPITPQGNPYSAGIAYVLGTDNMYVSTGATEGMSGASYSVDGGHSWTDYDEIAGTQLLSVDFTEGRIGWAGGFNTDSTTGGMWKHGPGVPKPAFQVGIIGGKGITVTIKNVGDANATNVNYNVTITGGMFIKPRQSTGSKPTLNIGDNMSAPISVIGIGWGVLSVMPKITVKVTCAEGSSAVYSKDARILFSRVILQ